MIFRFNNPLITFLVLILSQTCHIEPALAQSPKFQIVHGGLQTDLFYSIDTITSNLFLVTGETESFGAGNRDLMLCTVDSFGALINMYCYGGIKDESSGRRSVKLQDGGRLWPGSTNSYGVNTPAASNGLIIKLDSNYNPVWSRVIEGLGLESLGDAVQLANDSFIYICGMTNTQGFGGNDMLLIKISNSGSILWQKVIGSPDNEYAWRMQKTMDNKIAIIGTTFVGNIFTSENITFMKVDTSGNIVWSKVYGGNSWDGASAFLCTTDSGFLIAGGGYSFGVGSQDVYLFKLDKLGNVQWFSTYGDIYDDIATNVQQYVDPSGTTRHYYVCGYSPGLEDTSASWGNYRGFLLSVDPGGQQEWVRMYGPGPSNYVYDMKILNNFDYIVCGAGGGINAQDGWLIRSDPQGVTFCDNIPNGTTQMSFTMPVSSALAAQPCSLNVIIPTLTFTTVNGLTNVICSNNFPTSIPSDQPGPNKVINIFPNPNTGVFQLTLPDMDSHIGTVNVFNLLGQVAYTTTLDSTQLNLDLSANCKAGLYIVEVQIGHSTFISKLAIKRD